MSQYPPDPADLPQPNPFSPSLPDQVGTLPSDSPTHNYPASMYTNPLAIGSLVAGLASVLLITTCFCCGPFALIGSAPSVIAIILGLIALSQIKVGNGTGRRLAISGIICGLLSLLILIAAVSWFFFQEPKQKVDGIQWPNAEPIQLEFKGDEPVELPDVQLIPVEPVDEPVDKPDSEPVDTPPKALQPKDVPDDKPRQSPENQQTAPKELESNSAAPQEPRNADTRSVRDACQAGAIPARTPTANETATPTATRRPVA